VTITAASMANPMKSAAAVVRVTTAIFVTVSSASDLIQVTGAVQFHASVANDAG
jgi:hypothetical protein